MLKIIQQRWLSMHFIKNRTITVGPSFCGQTHFLLNKLQCFRCDNPEQQIKIITRSPKQYINTEGALGIDIENVSNVSVEEGLKKKIEQYKIFKIVVLYLMIC